MIIRQATRKITMLLLFLAIIPACAPSNLPLPTFTDLPPTLFPTQPPTLIPSPLPTATITPLACLTNPGRVEEHSLDLTNPPQKFRIYLPPCYDENTGERYPVLYLLHGQTFSDDQWIRLGAVNAADRLILSEETLPFIIVFPDDPYWNLPPGAGFGQRVVDGLIPHVDATYRTLPDRGHRAIGGLSRGAGWALRLGLTRWDLFESIGLHSLAVLHGDGSGIGDWLTEIPPASYPRIFMDVGDNDPELTMTRAVESQFNDFGLAHEWYLYNGAHTEGYWSKHVEEYIRWYVAGWNNP